jgi:hypothetical protein
VNTQLLLYRRPVALQPERHAGVRLHLPAHRFAFASQCNSFLLAATEVWDASRDYPVLFIGRSGADFTLAALLGLKDQQNLFVGPDGAWRPSTYIPAFVRRYPFVLAEADASSGQAPDSFTVCIDEDYAGLIRNAEEGTKDVTEPLFTPDGAQSPYLAQIVEFLRQYHEEMRRTRLLATRIAEMGLLAHRVVEIVRSGNKTLVDGFWAVDEAKLAGLSGQSIRELMKTGAMSLIYAHLHSLRRVSALAALWDEAAQVIPAAPRPTN